jgi:hypothetical protein
MGEEEPKSKKKESKSSVKYEVNSRRPDSGSEFQTSI